MVYFDVLSPDATWWDLSKLLIYTFWQLTKLQRSVILKTVMLSIYCKSRWQFLLLLLHNKSIKLGLPYALITQTLCWVVSYCVDNFFTYQVKFLYYSQVKTSQAVLSDPKCLIFGSSCHVEPCKGNLSVLFPSCPVLPHFVPSSFRVAPTFPQVTLYFHVLAHVIQGCPIWLLVISIFFQYGNDFCCCTWLCCPSSDFKTPRCRPNETQYHVLLFR